MEYSFSRAAATIKPSAIREILKFTSLPGIIPFAAGNPAPEAFPTEAVAEISDRLLRTAPIDALQYSVTEGYTPLRNHLKADLHDRCGMGQSFDELIVTSGAQQVMSLAVKAFCNPGDEVFCEDPSFIGSLNAFRAGGAKLVGVPMQPDGIDLERLEQALKEARHPRLLYVIPNFQNPTGVTLSREKRPALYELAKRYGVLILEDNPYGELRFAGEDIPTIKSMDTEGIVIYAGTFSKVLSPGMRIGYCLAPAPVIQKLVALKQTQDVHSSIWAQQVADVFLTEYDFPAHLERLREIYCRKAMLCMEQAEQLLQPEITFHPVEGGLFLWCRLPSGTDMQKFCTVAVSDFHVAVVPGNAFSVDENAPSDCFRINYSTPTDEQIVEGMQQLKRTKEKLL